MKSPKKHTGTISHFTKDGSGVIEEEGRRPLHVYNTIPGEEVEVTTTKRIKRATRAELDRVVSPSPQRVEPRCPYATVCGGCKWQHIDYPFQPEWKLQLIADAFASENIVCPISEIISAKESFYYRNRMDYVFGRDGELGLRQPGKWWAPIDLKACFLLSPESVEIMERVRTWSRESGLPFWNSKTNEGFFRYLVFREGKRTGERMVMVVTGSQADAEKIMKQLPEVIGDGATSVLWGINPTITDLSQAETIIPLKGGPWIHEEVNGLRYKITPNAFFQTNTVMAEQLQNTVKEFCGDLTGKTFLDLYCGSGFFALAFANEAKKTVGIELSQESIEVAKENAAVNSIDAEFFVSKAEEFAWAAYAPDVVILDPPRAGLHPKVIETVLEAKPERIVYVSCSVYHFVKEWAHLGDVYTITQARALDLFPHTPHVECVFLLEKK